MGKPPFASWEEVERLVSGFEEATLLGEGDWTHRDHVAVATYYVLLDEAAAVAAMRRGIQALNAARGVPTTPTGGYHETLTVAWVRILARFLSCCEGPSMLDALNAAVTEFADKAAVLRHYSRDRIMSVEARYGWVEPDLEPL